jgi:hypothetical protein
MTDRRLKDAYLPSRRVWLGANVASVCAGGLLLGLLGSSLTWFGRSDFFDLADNSLDSVKIGVGFLGGPVAILFALPLVLPRRGQATPTRLYRARVLGACGLWVAGLVILLAKVDGLDGYTLKAGTYISAGFLVVGLLATLAMWPSGLEVVTINRKGAVWPPREERVV